MRVSYPWLMNFDQKSQDSKARDEVSYDIHILFSQDDFPDEALSEVLALFDAPEVEIDARGTRRWRIATRERRAGPSTFRYFEVEIDPVTGEQVWIHTSSVWAYAYELSAFDYERYPGFRWCITLESSMGRSAKAFWMQFAIPYYILGIIQGSAAEDCQCWNLDNNLPILFTDPEEWAEHASYSLVGIGAARRLRWLGLMDDERNALF